MTRHIALITLVAIAGCAPRAEDHPFQCPDGTTIKARGVADSVYVQMPEGTVTLGEAVSASGARYANDTLEVWQHDGELRVTKRGKVVHASCKAPRSGL